MISSSPQLLRQLLLDGGLQQLLPACLAGGSALQLIPGSSSGLSSSAQQQQHRWMSTSLSEDEDKTGRPTVRFGVGWDGDQARRGTAGMGGTWGNEGGSRVA